MDIRQMMKQAQKVQEQLARQAEELRVEGNAGGGMVTVVSNGSKQVLSLKIDPEVVSKDDVEMLQDLILAALNDAHRKVDDADAEERRRHARRQDSRILELQIPESPKPVARSLNRAASRTSRASNRTVPAPARHWRQRRAAPGVPRAAHPA